MLFRIGILLIGLAVLAAHAKAPLLPPHPNPQPAPAFELDNLEGKMRTLKDYEGKVLVVNFWATWCPPCIKEMPSLQRAWEQTREHDIAIVAVNMGETPEAIERFLRRFPVEFPILLDRDVKVADAWDVRGLPTTFVLDPTGRFVFKVAGERVWDDPELLAQLRALAKP